MKAIRNLSTAILAISVPFSLYYAYSGLSWAYTHSFVSLARWVRRGWAEQLELITPAMKWTYFVAWALPVVGGLIGFFFAFRILILLRQGRVFDPLVATGLRWIGVAVFLSSALHMGAACISPMIQSWNNTGGAEPLRFWYSHAYVSLLFCGFGFWVMGQVMTLAIKAVRENEEFV